MTSKASILWCDGEGFSAKPESLRRRFLETMNEACATIKWNHLRDAGDGVAMTFQKDPRDALAACQTLSQSLDGLIKLRFGLHFGELEEGHLDALQTEKPLGDAMIVGARAMSLGKGGHVLLTEEFVLEAHKVQSNFRDKVAFVGETRVKTQTLRIYNFWDGALGRVDFPSLAKPGW